MPTFGTLMFAMISAVNSVRSILEKSIAANSAKKNLWLADWMKQKVAAKTARFYQESTFLFDE